MPMKVYCRCRRLETKRRLGRRFVMSADASRQAGRLLFLCWGDQAGTSESPDPVGSRNKTSRNKALPECVPEYHQAADGCLERVLGTSELLLIGSDTLES